MLEQLSTLPPQIRGLLTFVAGGGIIALLFSFDKNLALIALAGVFVTTCLLAGYKRILGKMQQRKTASMSGQIQEHSGSAPVGINDPAKRARLDDLKRTFDSGLDRFRTSGKDVYKLPWYLIVGEPGSGKTEAVRHCNVGFPPGLQDELQGTGGTINMNWWFTNHAVMLDTAGRLMFEEIKPGETSEWREFLQLLRRNRPNCPVNGLLLVIPAEALIRDTGEEIAKKAGKIAQQLDLIQRTLDIRFPVFILVTKCDLLSGFREFFEGLNDPATQHQMIGWSNPEPRDSVFRPELVTQYLESVVERVRKRRLGLMRDPVPEKEGGKRADEVDALYGLPHSLSLIAPRLRSYLEKVFVAGEWSAKPLFLRGIYFTSAMREGAALDQELAEALGVSLDDLPEGRAWERERAYFLRDLFMEKAFREKGLVTRATNTKALLRKRRVYLYGAGIAALVAFLGFSWFGYQQLKSSIGQQSALWAHGKKDWNGGTWHPLLARDGAGALQYMGDKPAFPNESMSLVQYHDAIRDVCEKNIQIGWVFKPVAGFVRLDNDRYKAQRVLFEGSIVGPVVKEARNEMVNPARDAGPLPVDLPGAMVREARAVAALLGLEADTVAGKGDVVGLPEHLLLPLIRYGTSQERAADAGNFQQLANTLRWTYQQNSRGHWPPPWLTAGTTLAGNRPVQLGLERMIRYANESARTQEESLQEIRQLRDLLRAFRQKEAEMNTAAGSPDPRAVYGQMHQLHEDLQPIKTKLDAALKEALAKGLGGEGGFMLGTAYERLIGGSNSASKEAFDLVGQAVADYAAKPTDPVNTQHPIFVQVDAKLKEVRADITRRVAQGFTPEEQAELKLLDQALLADFGNGKRLYEVRAATYESAHAQLFVEVDRGGLIGKNWSALSTVTSALDRQRQSVAALKEKVSEPFTAACKYYLDRAEEIRLDQVLKAYIEQTRNTFDSKFNYPLVKGGSRGGMGKGGYAEAERLLAAWRADITSPALQRASPARRQKLEAFLSAVDGIGRIIPSLNGSVTIGLVSYSSAGDKSGLNKFRKVQIRGHEYDTSTDSIGASYSFFDTFSAEFLDYSVTPRKSYGYSSSVLDLVNRARGSGRITVTVDGLPIGLNVHANSAPPDLANLPDKGRILATLN